MKIPKHEEFILLGSIHCKNGISQSRISGIIYIVFCAENPADY